MGKKPTLVRFFGGKVDLMKPYKCRLSVSVVWNRDYEIRRRSSVRHPDQLSFCFDTRTVKTIGGQQARAGVAVIG